MKKTKRTILSLIPPLIYTMFFGWLLINFLYLNLSGILIKTCGIGILLAVIAMVFILVWRFDLVKNIKYYIVTFFISGIAILITWMLMLNTNKGDWVLCYSAIVVLLSVVWFWKAERTYKEIVVLLLIHPILYYLIFFLVFIVGLAYG